MRLGSKAGGRQVHGEMTGGTGSSGTTNLYIAGSTTSTTVGATERLIITDVFVTSAAALLLKLVSGSDAAGKVAIAGYAAAAGGWAKHFNSEFVCGKGETPKLSQNATGSSVGTLEGIIISNQ
jgi:hypothetical protein